MAEEAKDRGYDPAVHGGHDHDKVAQCLLLLNSMTPQERERFWEIVGR